MGNSFGTTKTTKVMKISGETIKLKTPIQAGEVIKDYPGYVLLESEAVKHFGIRAKPLEPQQELKAKRLYFLVEMPKIPEAKSARRVRSGINMSAKDRLESLMLARRSVSDLTIMKPTSVMVDESKERLENGEVRLKMRLPRAELEKLMMESKDKSEAAERIVDLYMANNSNGDGIGVGVRRVSPNNSKIQDGALLLHQQMHRNGGHGTTTTDGLKAREKRVGFMPISEGEIQLAVAS